MPDKLRRRPRRDWLRWLGIAVVILSLVFFGRALANLDVARLTHEIGAGEWFLLGVAAFMYAAALCMLAIGWTAMAAPGESLGFPKAIAIYGPSVVAKYLPGSVFQYASRQFLGSRHGFAHGQMVKASFAEVALHTPCALMAVTVLLTGAGLLGLGAIGVLGLVLARVGRNFPIVRSAASQLLFFAAFAGVAILLAQWVIGAQRPELLAGLFLLAWIAGFLVPVAPGGIGVREAALLALSAGVADPATATQFAIVTRLATTIGDGLLGLAGYLVDWAREKRHASA